MPRTVSTAAQVFAEGLTEKFSDIFFVRPGNKLDKILVITKETAEGLNPIQLQTFMAEGGEGVHAFVEKSTGFVLKAASYSQPAEGVRFETVEDALEAADPHGSYLYKW